MITTESLITTIVADHATRLDADPQAVIARLKQDLRSARQAATKARQYAEKMCDGAGETIRAENERLRQELHEARRQRSNAQRSLRDAQVSLADLRAELSAERLRNASRGNSDAQSATDESEPDEPLPTIDPELVELRRLITALRTEDHERYAPAVCWSLNQVKVITNGLRDATGKFRRKGRVAA